MSSKWTGIFIFLLLVSFNAHDAYSDEMEIKFKEIGNQIQGDLKTEQQIEEEVHFKGKTYTQSDVEKIKIAERRLKKCKNELRDLIKKYPRSIWADDAQYMITTLEAGDIKQQVLDLEYLLKEYPDMQLEEWTRKTIIAPNPSMSFKYIIMSELCLNYDELGETEKLKHMCEEAIKEYPDKAVFKKLLQKTATSSK